MNEEQLESRGVIEAALEDFKIAQKELVDKKYILRESLGMYLNSFPKDTLFVWEKLQESDPFPSDYDSDTAEREILEMKEKRNGR